MSKDLGKIFIMLSQSHFHENKIELIDHLQKIIFNLK